MAATPTRPRTETEPSEDLKRTLDQHVCEDERDAKDRVPARDVFKDGPAKLAKLKHPRP